MKSMRKDLKAVEQDVYKRQILLCGESGCGKTTLTRLINGLIPHYYGGKLTGQDVYKRQALQISRILARSNPFSRKCSFAQAKRFSWVC